MKKRNDKVGNNNIQLQSLFLSLSGNEKSHVIQISDKQYMQLHFNNTTKDEDYSQW